MSRRSAAVKPKCNSKKPPHPNFIESTHQWAEDDPDPLKHFAGVRALQVLQAMYLDGDWAHVFEALEESERANPSLDPTLLRLLLMVKGLLPKRKGGKGGRAPATHRNLAIIAYAFEIQFRRRVRAGEKNGPLLRGFELDDLLPEELDLIVQAFAQTGVEKPVYEEGARVVYLTNEHVRRWQCRTHKAMRNLISGVISEYRKLPAPHAGVRKVKR